MPTGTITADSKPVYCWFGGSDCWTCNDLVQWHQQMVIVLGKDEANKRFIDSFTNDTPLICEQLDCRSFNSNFRSYFSQQGILSDLYTGLAVIAQPIGIGTDIVNNGGNAISSLGKGAENTAKVLQYLIPTVVVLAAISIFIYVAKQVKLI